MKHFNGFFAMLVAAGMISAGCCASSDPAGCDGKETAVRGAEKGGCDMHGGKGGKGGCDMHGGKGGCDMHGGKGGCEMHGGKGGCDHKAPAAPAAPAAK